VTGNDEEAAFKAVGFAVQQGYRKIAHFAGYSHINIGITGFGDLEHSQFLDRRETQRVSKILLKFINYIAIHQLIDLCHCSIFFMWLTFTPYNSIIFTNKKSL